jgi:threonine/homoserine/homoserine lactone efflux protein
MLDLSKLPLFFAASIILLLTPGPAVLYIITRSISQGRLAGFVSVLSIETGNLFHALAAALGLSALLLSSALLFTAVKYLGAAYLIYLGLRKLFARDNPNGPVQLEPQSLRRIYSQGVLVAILNPKTALFFVAFLPQFVDPAQGAAAPQLLALGCLFVSMALISDGLYALLAGSVAQRLKGRWAFGGLSRTLTGSVYIGLGITAALADGGRQS